MGFSMAELEMLPTWAGRVAEPVHPPQPPIPPRRNGSDIPANGSDILAEGNGHGYAVLAGQPPLPSGEHRLEAAPDPGPGLGYESDDIPGGRPAASATTSELPVVSIPFEDEAAPAPDTPPEPVDELIDTIEAPVDGFVFELEDESELVDEDDVELDDDFVLVEAELVEDELESAAGYGEPPQGEGLFDDLDRPPTGGGHLDEIVYESDEIELLEDTDPVGIAPVDNSPLVVPVAGPEISRSADREQEVERDRPVMRVLSLLALAFVVVAAGVAAGYLFVAVTGG